MKLNKNKRDGHISEEYYRDQISKLSIVVKNLNKELVILQGKIDARQLAKERLRCILDAVNNFQIEDKFNDELFKSLVEKITVKNRVLTFYLKIGITKLYRIK